MPGEQYRLGPYLLRLQDDELKPVVVLAGEQDVPLTPLQRRLLAFLVNSGGRVHRVDAFEHVWNGEVRGDPDRGLQQQIDGLEASLKAKHKRQYIAPSGEKFIELKGLVSYSPNAPHKTYRAFTSKLPVVNPTLIGRESQLAFLDGAWINPASNFVQVVAAGGTGKTALIDKWFRRHLDEATVFGWSFYSQGASVDRPTSSDPFFTEILEWLQIDIAPTASVYAKAEAIANRFRQQRVLLILDGIEPLQDATGDLRDLALKALLQELSTSNLGLVVCTTRMRVHIPDDPPRSLSIDLENLSPEQGADYLRHLTVKGTHEDLQQASREYWNHALALTLLGTYLVDFCGADVRRRIEIPEILEQGSHAERVIAAYERMFTSTPELEILRGLGHFDRPAEREALRLVRPKLDYRRYQGALKRLYTARLILTRDPALPLDCHPLVRQYFATQSTREGHHRLYEHYLAQARPYPDTLEEMTPLFYAVYHGSRAGKYNDVLRIFYDRINRGDGFYLVRQLGALGTNLSVLANFFETPWNLPVAAVEPSLQAWVIGSAGFALRAFGRLSDALEPTRLAAERAANAKNFVHAAGGYNNLCELHLALGNLKEALPAAQRSMEFADAITLKYRSNYWQNASRTMVAHALHQLGELSEAARVFAEAEGIQTDRPLLYGLAGYRYCVLLLDQGQSADVLRRSSQTLEWDRDLGLLSVGLDHLIC